MNIYNVIMLSQKLELPERSEGHIVIQWIECAWNQV